MIGVAHIRRREDDRALPLNGVLIPGSVLRPVTGAFILRIRRIPAVQITILIHHINAVESIAFNRRQLAVQRFQIIPDDVRIRMRVQGLLKQLREQLEGMRVVRHNAAELFLCLLAAPG